MLMGTINWHYVDDDDDETHIPIYNWNNINNNMNVEGVVYV